MTTFMIKIYFTAEYRAAIKQTKDMHSQLVSLKLVKQCAFIASHFKACHILSHRCLNMGVFHQKKGDVMIDLYVICIHNNALYV